MKKTLKHVLSFLSIGLALGLAMPTLAVTDTVAPSVGGVTPTAVTPGTYTTFSVSYNDPDPSFGIDHCDFILDGGILLGTLTLGSNPSVDTGTFGYTFPSVGTHTLNTQCKDIAGNWGYGAITTITVAAAAPGTVGAVTPVSPKVNVPTTFSATYSGFTAPLTASDCWLVVDGSTVYPAMGLSGGTGSVSGTASKDYTFTTLGAHTMFVSCLETGGTYRPGTATDITVVEPVPSDVTPPAIGVINYSASAYIGTTVTVSASYSDSGTGVSYCYLQVNGTRQTPDMTIGSPASGTASRSFTFPAAGTYMMYVACTDAVGNGSLSTLSSVTATAAPVTDVISPTVGPISPTTAGVGATVTISAGYSDGGTGVNQCQLYEGTTLVWTSGTFGPLGSGTATVGYAFSSLGAHTMHMRCRDVTGNWGTGPDTVVNVTATAVADTIPPVVGVVQQLTAVAGGSTNLTASASDNVGVARCDMIVNGVDRGIMYYSGGYASGYYAFPSAGTYNVHILCYDLIGNSAGSPAERAIVVSAPSAGVIPFGSLIKLTCPSGALADNACKAVYYYGTDGKRHAFSNSKVYFTWYPDFSGVQDVSLGFLSSLTLGRNVTYRPGIRMVKFTTVNTVYAVARGGILRPIASEAVARALYGVNWNMLIDDISDAFYANYTFGASINNASDYNPSGETSAVTTIDANF